MWVRERYRTQVVWAIEDCRHLSARLERDLITAWPAGGASAAEVDGPNPGDRAHARQVGSDRRVGGGAGISAGARSCRSPPMMRFHANSNCWSIAAKSLLHNALSTINRLLWRVHELDPERAPKPRSLDLTKHRRILNDWLVTQSGLVAELAREELADITRLTQAIDALAKRIGVRIRTIAPALLAMPGCGELTAAKLVGEAAGVSRFKSEAAFARHAGVAPVPVWSGNTAGRVRMTRSGNRQLNAALHRIAVTQIRLEGLGQTYYRHRLTHGDSKTRGSTLPQTPPIPRRLQPPPHRPSKPTPALPTGSGLT